MPEMTDQSTTSWANVLGANLPVSVESVRCVEWTHKDDHGTYALHVIYDDGFVVVERHKAGDNGPYLYRTLVDLMREYLPPTDATLAALHRLRLSATHPVAFVCEPEPGE